MRTMTESEWMACIDSEAMLRFLRGKTSDRKLRLFAAAAFGRLAALLPDRLQRWGIAMLERLAEGTITRAESRSVTAEVRRAIPPDTWVPGSPPADHPHYVALMLYREFCSSSIAAHAVHASAGLMDGVGERREQARLMRCIFGYPCRSVAADPTWLTFDVLDLARTAYEEWALDRMPIVGYALEEAGCDDEVILSHCRGPGPHIRGCWVVDAILGES